MLFVDADAIIHTIPDYFETIAADMAVHLYNGRQLASGTLYFHPSPDALKLLDAWAERNRTCPGGDDQLNLQCVINERIIPGLVVCYLSEEYCKIHDLAIGNINAPVIEHFQASRRLKHEEDMSAIEKRRYSRLWRDNYQPSVTSKHLGNYVEQHVNTAHKLLEIGCGDGSVVYQLRDQAYSCVGCDITLSGIKLDHSGFYEAPVWRMPFKDFQFDYTFSTDVLEHIPATMVDAAVKELLRVTARKTFHIIANFSHLVDGVELHQIQKPAAWWIQLFDRHNESRIEIEIIDRKDFLQMFDREKK